MAESRGIISTQNLVFNFDVWLNFLLNLWKWSFAKDNIDGFQSDFSSLFRFAMIF